jgi:hypothetical protein
VNPALTTFKKFGRAVIAGERAGFISPSGFLAMHLFQGAAWILLALLALKKGAAGSPLFFAVIHAFGLGFLSLAAMSVLVHVLPAAAGLAIGNNLRDRGAIGGVILGALLFVGGWIVPNLKLSLAGGGVIFLSEGYFLGRVIQEIAGKRGHGGLQGIGLGLMIGGALTFFLAGSLLGILMLLTLLSPVFTLSLVKAPPAHALMMIGGWLTLLVMAIFLRTSGPLLGRSLMGDLPVRGWLLAGSGIILALPGLLIPLPILLPPGFALGAAGVILYGIPLKRALGMARPVNRIPLWFLRSSFTWLLSGGLLLFFSMGSRHPPLAVILLIFLVGGVGQFFLAHLYHLGPRLLSILRNGPGDLTPPVALLNRKRSIATFLLYQAGIAFSVLSFFREGDLSSGMRLAGATTGFLAWIFLSLEIRSGWMTAGRFPETQERILFPIGGKKE